MSNVGTEDLTRMLFTRATKRRVHWTCPICESTTTTAKNVVPYCNKHTTDE